jgi:hypothetical protein
VATAGSNPSRGDDELRIEISHPPYLFRGLRPFIENAPEKLTYGDEFILHTPNAIDIRWVQVIRPMATTHSTDSEQHLVDLRFTPKGVCELEVTVPEQANATTSSSPPPTASSR